MAPSVGKYQIMNTQAISLRSRYTNTEYQIGVWLPFSYSEAKRRYPVRYLTDGDLTFGPATGLVPTLIGNGEIPEILAVGISYAGIENYGEFGRLREPELLPQGICPSDTKIEGFSSMVKDELIPLIENSYLASPENRALLGFSAGGFYPCTPCSNIWGCSTST